MSLRIWLACFSFFLISSLFHQMIQAAEPRRPNIIFILTDDQGWGDAGFAGHPYVKTPHLDQLAKQGTWFKQFYVAATVCSPSRMAFMTGRFPAQGHIHGHIASHEQNVARSMPDWLDPKFPTITRLLKESGYATGHFGKWHLGTGNQAPLPGVYGIDDHRTTTTVEGAPTWDDANTPDAKAKSTTQIMDETIRFIKSHQSEPFYVNVWTRLPHAPLGPTPDQLEPYASLKPNPNAPEFGKWMQGYLKSAKNLKSQMQIFCAALSDIDTQLGRLLHTLDELHLAEDTLIFYSSDNGPEDYRISNAANGGVGNTGPLRARKRSMYEGGIRTFGILRWPGKVPSGRVDETSVIGGVDWLPTICKVTGTPLPDNLKLDGEDVSDIWYGHSRPRKQPLHWEWLFNVQGREEGYMPPMLATRHGDWKFFVQHDGSHPELYHIPSDISESKNVATDHPDLVKQLTTMTLDWQKSLPPCEARNIAAASGSPIDVRSKTQAAQSRPNTPTKPTPAKPIPDRRATFKTKDTNQDGKLTLEEYLHRFPDQAEGKRRFPTFDTDHDGILTETEFVKAGRP